MPFRPVRFDALVCSKHMCEALAALPPDQARARRMLHDAVESEVAVARDVGASRREGRQALRGMLKVKRIGTTPPRP
jgi:hypothetical protein